MFVLKKSRIETYSLAPDILTETNNKLNLIQLNWVQNLNLVSNIVSSRIKSEPKLIKANSRIIS